VDQMSGWIDGGGGGGCEKSGGKVGEEESDVQP